MQPNNSFSDIDPLECLLAGERDSVMEAMEFKSFPRRSLIFSESDKSDTVYFIRKGRVRAFKTTPTGDEIITGFWSRGHILGGLSAIIHQPRFLSAETLDPSEMYSMSIRDLEDIVPTAPFFFLNVTRAIASTASTRLERIFHQVADTATSKLIAVLISLAQLPESNTNPTYTEISGISQKDLAFMIGVSRPWVSEILSRLQSAEVLYISRKKILIPSLERLEQEAMQFQSNSN